MTDAPKFRRGIKLGRIRKVKKPVEINVLKKVPGRRTKVPTGEKKTIYRTIGYQDKKTGKFLNAQEVAKFKSYHTERWSKALKKLPEGSFGRVKKQSIEGEEVFVDRFTGNRISDEKSRDIIHQAREYSLQGNLPKQYAKAVRTINSLYSAETGMSREETEMAIRNWYLEYENWKDEGMGPRPAFPFDSDRPSEFRQKARKYLSTKKRRNRRLAA